MKQSDLLNKLYKECSLSTDDVYRNQNYAIITRSGIEKIQYAKNIRVEFVPVYMNIEMVVIKAKGFMNWPNSTKQKMIETFGEWNHTHTKKDKSGNIVPFYGVAMAEKRALSRVVLKLANLYEYGFIGEDETIYEGGASSEQRSIIEGLLRSSTLDDDLKDAIRYKLMDITEGEADNIIRDLKMNQLEGMELPGYGQRQINERLDKQLLKD